MKHPACIDVLELADTLIGLPTFHEVSVEIGHQNTLAIKFPVLILPGVAALIGDETGILV